MADKYYRITYSCGCGANEDFLVFKNQDEADAAAYEMAVEEFDRFSGYHGIPSEEEIAEDEFGKSLDEMNDAELAEVWEFYCQERESWISYGAKEISEHDYLVGIGELDDDFEDEELYE